MPYKNVGAVKNATINAAVNLERDGSDLRIKVYATSVFKDAHVKLYQNAQVLTDDVQMLSPTDTFDKTMANPTGADHDFRVVVTDSIGRELVSYQPAKDEVEQIPDAARRSLHQRSYRRTRTLLSGTALGTVPARHVSAS